MRCRNIVTGFFSTCILLAICCRRRGCRCCQRSLATAHRFLSPILEQQCDAQQILVLAVNDVVVVFSHRMNKMQRKYEWNYFSDALQQWHWMNVPSIHKLTTVWQQKYSTFLNCSAPTLWPLVLAVRQTRTKRLVHVARENEFHLEFGNERHFCHSQNFGHVLCTLTLTWTWRALCRAYEENDVAFPLETRTGHTEHVFQANLNCKRKLSWHKLEFLDIQWNRWHFFLNGKFSVFPVIWPFCPCWMAGCMHD